MKNIRLVVFDIAGTIIEDRGEVVSSFKLALESNGIAASDDELRERKGASKREVIRWFVERQPGTGTSIPDQVERTYGDFRRILEEQYQDGGITPIRGAEETLHWLLAHKLDIATTTGFYREIRDMILEKTGWKRILHNNVCSTDVTMGRPAPFMIFHAMENAGVTDVSEVIIVGDTPLDLQAGANAGVRGRIAVLTGTHTEERLRREPHTHILSSVAGLPALLQADFVV
jgi:phosphoglycolate phosphatase